MREMQRCTVKVNAELHFGIFRCGNKKGLKLGRSANPLYYVLTKYAICQQSCKIIRENA